jgi:hypothetical protein
MIFVLLLCFSFLRKTLDSSRKMKCVLKFVGIGMCLNDVMLILIFKFFDENKIIPLSRVWCFKINLIKIFKNENYFVTLYIILTDLPKESLPKTNLPTMKPWDESKTVSHLESVPSSPLCSLVFPHCNFIKILFLDSESVNLDTENSFVVRNEVHKQVLTPTRISLLQ